MKKNNKKNVKIIALVIVAFFTLGIVGVAVSQTQVGFAAPASSSIGYIDTQKAVQNHPDTKAAEETLQAEQDSLRKEFEEKSKTLSDQEKQLYAQQLQQKLMQRNAELFQSIADKVKTATKKVADAKGISIVVERNAVIYGGVDLTDDVIKAYASTKK